MSTTSSSAPNTLPNPNDRTTTTPVATDLGAMPARAAQFLYGVVSTPALRATLALAGLTSEEIVDGRERLDACLAEAGPANAFDRATMEKRRAALSELNAWDEPGFARLGAALKRHAPDAHAYVFGGVVASDVPQEAALGVATLLGRVAVLEAGTTRPADPIAIAILEERGFTRELRQHLLSLVGTALGPAADESVFPPLEAARTERLQGLATWYEEWAETARALVRKREDLVRLGLGSSRAKSGKPRGRKPRRPASEPIPDTERAPVKPLRLYPSTSAKAVRAGENGAGS